MSWFSGHGITEIQARWEPNEVRLALVLKWKPRQRLGDSLGQGDGGKSKKDQTARVSRKKSQRRDGGIEWSLEMWKHSLVSAESSSHAYEDTTQCWRGNFERLILDNSSHCLSEVKNIAPFHTIGGKNQIWGIVERISVESITQWWEIITPQTKHGSRQIHFTSLYSRASTVFSITQSPPEKSPR